MFNNLSKEIIWFSLIPFVVILLVDLILFFVFKSKRTEFVFNYLIKMSMIVVISLVLPLIVGYTWWIIELFWEKEIFFDNFAYICLIIFLSLCLLTLMIWVYLRSLQLTNKIKENEA